MALYRYKAVSPIGQVSQGTVEASTITAANEVLSDRGLVVVRLHQVRGVHRNFRNINIGGPRMKDIVIFARQLAVMVQATVPIVPALRVLSQQTDSSQIRDVAKQMADDVDGGLPMSQAFGRHPKVFSRFFVAMIHSGETSGRLDEVLNYLADQMEKDYDLVNRIRGAMIYPAIIVLVMIAVGIVMMVYVIPNIANLLKESGGELPIATRILIQISDFMTIYWWTIPVIFVGVIALLRAYTATKSGRDVWSRIILKVPVFGLILNKVILVRLTRSLATLIKGGVPIGTALEITSEVVDNAAYREVLVQTIKEVQDGNSITTVTAESRLIPKIVTEMMAVGEQTGKLDEILERLGNFYDREVTTLVSTLTSLIEPIILVTLGVGVAFMVGAVMVPMMELARSFQ